MNITRKTGKTPENCAHDLATIKTVYTCVTCEATETVCTLCQKILERNEDY